MKKRARGRAYECACGEEKLRLPRSGPNATQGGWVYLWGECGGGVKLRFDGSRVAETRAVGEDERKRVEAHAKTALARPTVDQAYEARLAELTARRRERVEHAERVIRERGADLVKAGVEIGEQLLVANEELGHGHFGLFLERLRLNREQAFTAMKIAGVVRSAPRFFGTFQKMGQEKTALLARLSAAKRLEVLEQGVVIEGTRVPITEVAFRPLNAWIRSVAGKSARGRKPGAKAKAERTTRYGLPVDLFDLFHQTIDGLKRLETYARDGFEGIERERVANLWRHVNHRFQLLQHDYKLADLLEEAR